jgi:dihydroflavonol-4-reductase
MQVLVTGGTGFVGASLVAALARRGDQVRVLRRESSSLKALAGLEVEHVLGDVLEREAVERAVKGCDLVFHVAAISSYWRSQRDQIYKVNVEGTRVVMEACLQAGVPRVVHTSSIAAIGIPPEGTLGTEETAFDELSKSFPYADSKRLAEEEVRGAVARGLAAVIVNPGTVIGPGDHYMVSGSIVVEMAHGRVPAVPPGGMPVVDIEAVVQGHLAAAERGRVGERYVLNGENLSHMEVARVVGAVIGKRPPRIVLPRWLLPPLAAAIDLFNRVSPRPPLISGDQIRVGGSNIFFDPAKAVRELGLPLLPFRQAVERAYLWYRDHGYL